MEIPNIKLRLKRIIKKSLLSIRELQARPALLMKDRSSIFAVGKDDPIDAGKKQNMEAERKTEISTKRKLDREAAEKRALEKKIEAEERRAEIATKRKLDREAAKKRAIEKKKEAEERSAEIVTKRKLDREIAKKKAIEKSVEKKKEEDEKKQKKIKWERDWFRFFYQCYASEVRFNEYGEQNKFTGLLHKELKSFVHIKSVTKHIYAPENELGILSNKFIYFGARVQVLNRVGNSPLLYSLSYHGNHDFAHSDSAFDNMRDLRKAWNGKSENELITNEFGALRDTLENFDHKILLRSKLNYYVPLSFNCADFTGNGVDDFLLGGRLYISTTSMVNHSAHTEFDTFAGQESAFLSINGKIILATVCHDELMFHEWGEYGLVKLKTHSLSALPADNRPFTFLPLNGALLEPSRDGFIFLSEQGVDIYSVDINLTVILIGQFSVPQNGEVHIGARGSFTDNGSAQDIWFAEPRWKNSEGNVIGRAILLTQESILKATASIQAEDKQDISSVAHTVLYGNTRFTDYDGIGCTLSPIAGKVLGGSGPDLTITGHRHMNESGALFVVPYDTIIKGGKINIEDPSVVKIIGKPVSQLAPPFIHLDLHDMDGNGHDSIVVAADNDVLGGLNAGAVYLLDGKKITEEWERLSIFLSE